MRMSAAELVAHHHARIGVEGVAVRVVFPDQAGTIAFRDELLLEANEIPRSATRLVRTISLREGEEPQRAVLELLDGDGRAHRFFVGREDLMQALVAVPIVTPPMTASISEAPGGGGGSAGEQDDLLELAHIHTRLDCADDRLRRQQRLINTIMATYVEREHLRTRRSPSYCCQRCGEAIGWTGRALQAVGLRLHSCTFSPEQA